jgi:hypothetical protein
LLRGCTAVACHELQVDKSATSPDCPFRDFLLYIIAQWNCRNLYPQSNRNSGDVKHHPLSHFSGFTHAVRSEEAA